MKKYLLIMFFGISIFLLYSNNIFADTQTITKTSEDIISAEGNIINVNFTTTGSILDLNLNKPASFNTYSKFLSVHILTKNNYNGKGVIIKLHIYAIIRIYDGATPMVKMTLKEKEEDYVKEIVTNYPLHRLDITSQDAPTFIENFSNRIKHIPPGRGNAFRVIFGRYNDTLRCHVGTSDAPLFCISGKEGDDIIELGYGGGGYQDGGDGNDIIIGGPDGDHIEGSPGADVLIGRGGDDTLYALKSGPHPQVPDNQGDVLIGGTGDDYLCGNPSYSGEFGNHDILLGGDGKDVFIGFGGKDLYFLGFQNEGDSTDAEIGDDIIAY